MERVQSVMWPGNRQVNLEGWEKLSGENTRHEWWLPVSLTHKAIKCEKHTKGNVA